MKSKILGTHTGREGARRVYEARSVITCAFCSRELQPGEHFTRKKREGGGDATFVRCTICYPVDGPLQPIKKQRWVRCVGCGTRRLDKHAYTYCTAFRTKRDRIISSEIFEPGSPVCASCMGVDPAYENYEQWRAAWSSKTGKPPPYLDDMPLTDFLYAVWPDSTSS